MSGDAHEKSGDGGYHRRESDAMVEEWHCMGGGGGHCNGRKNKKLEEWTNVMRRRRRRRRDYRNTTVAPTDRRMEKTEVCRRKKKGRRDGRKTATCLHRGSTSEFPSPTLFDSLAALHASQLAGCAIGLIARVRFVIRTNNNLIILVSTSQSNYNIHLYWLNYLNAYWQYVQPRFLCPLFKRRL